MTVLAWHFLCQDYRPVFGRTHIKTPLKVGDLMRVRQSPVLCQWGLHACRRAIDALRYAPGRIICRVGVGGEIVEGWDKLAGQTRRILAMADVSEVLHEFICDMAEAALRSCGVTDERPWEAIAVKRRWLRGEVTDDDLDMAQGAAWNAARGASLAAEEAATEAEANDQISALNAAKAAVWAAAMVSDGRPWNVSPVVNAVVTSAWTGGWAGTLDRMNDDLDLRIRRFMGLGEEDG